MITVHIKHYTSKMNHKYQIMIWNTLQKFSFLCSRKLFVSPCSRILTTQIDNTINKITIVVCLHVQ